MLDYEKIGKFLQTLRIEKGYSQEKLAEMLFVTRQVISKWERGKSLPSNEMLLALCNIHNISANDILAGEKNNSKNTEKTKNVSLNVLKDGYTRRKKMIIKFSLFLVVLFIVFFSYYFLIHIIK